MTILNQVNDANLSNPPQALGYLNAIENYVPGKAKIGNKNQKFLKLSANENALGASKIAIKAYIEHSENIFRYADGSCSDLREKIAQKNNINASQIVCGAGSDELISLLTSAFCKEGDEVIYSEYGFLMYPISAKRVGANPIKVKEKNYRSDVHEILNSVTKKTKIIFIANPNNPTGSYLRKDEIDFLVKNLDKNILLILDQAYEEFVTVNDYPQAIDIVKNNANVVMLRTFSKIYGLASLRIGWCYCHEKIAEILHKIRGPFNVSGPAQACAIACLDDDDFLEKSRQHNQKWLDIYKSEIANLKNLIAHEALANFILLDFLNEKNCQNAQKIFLENNIILREMSAYSLNNCLRLTIGKDQENHQVLEILKQISKF